METKNYPKGKKRIGDKTDNETRYEKDNGGLTLKIVCEQCGALIDVNEDACPFCGCPIADIIMEY